MRIITQSFPRCVLIGSVLLLLSPYGWAAQSAQTSTVKGRAPVATPSITGTAAIGGKLTAAWGFADADGDKESGTTYSWSGGGASGSGLELLVPLAAGANTIILAVTPKTDATITDPAEGDSQAATVAIPAYLGGFSLTPDTVSRTWSDAETHCKGLGARLPTADELQDMFLSATSAARLGDFNNEMCSVYQWPNGSKECGGSHSAYWSSTAHQGTHHSVLTSNGYITSYTFSDSTLNHVACVR